MAAVTSGKGIGLRFDVDLGRAASRSGRLEPHDPMEVLLVADCSGRRARGAVASLSGRRARSISVENLDTVFAGFGAELEVPLGERTARLSPRALDDLHPDQLLSLVTPLAEPPALESSEPAEQGTNTEMLERLLGAPAGGAAPRPAPAASSDPRRVVDALIRGAVGDAAISRAQGSAVQARDSAAALERGRLLGAVLRSPAFGALEASWRAIDGVCRNCPDEELVRFRVLDASPAEVLADLDGFGALLDERRPSVVVVDDYVAATHEALEALRALLGVCASRGSILAIGASPALAGYASFAASDAPPEEVSPPASALDAWRELVRTREGGAQLALVLPRYLLRQPYGKLGESLDRLAFEEVVGGDHEAFSWGNGAYLAARALAERHAGAGTQLDGSVELGDLPIVRLPDDDGYRLQPTAEAWLPERAVERLRAAGFAVLQGMRDTDRVRVHL